MKILIEIPKESDYSKQDKEELFKMFKLICDNINTNGIICKKLN